MVNQSSSDPGIPAPSIVLTPKLRAPSLRPEQLVRPRLLGLLEGTSECKLTVISAPAGYGKTTLLTQWREAEKASLPFAWVTVDEQDNDPVRLWSHVVEALRQVVPEEDFAADVIGTMSAGGQELIETTLPILINRVQISAYLGKSERFDNAVADFAEAYAAQTERDHAALCAAVKSGRIAGQVGA